MFFRIKKDFIKRIVKEAVREDIGSYDITTEVTIPAGVKEEAFIIAKEGGVLCGVDIAKEVFKCVDKKLSFKALKKDGDTFVSRDIIAVIKGEAASILTAERVALNFLSLLSGISTCTKKFVLEAKEYNVKIMDTRKTTPTLRILEKYAVRTGGGFNHRFNLSAGIIVKDNHLKVLKIVNNDKKIDRQKLKEVISGLKKKTKFPIEIEVENLREFKEVIKHYPDIVMLDNFSFSSLKKAVDYRNQYFPGVKLEASGGIGLKNIRKIASSGVDFISVGALTHSASCIDFSLEIQ